MKDEKPGSPSEVSGGRPASLVERAARKIVVDHHRAPLEEASVASPLGGVVESASSAAGKEAVDHDGGGLPVDEVRQANGSQLPAGGERPAARRVDIDMARLASREFLTPQSKRSRAVEEFRLIKRKILGRRWADDRPFGNTVMVTSALPAEGKTTVSINLAMSIAAEEDLRVVLVDADFIKPDALRQLGISADKGLIDVVEDPRMDISDVILRTNVEKLSLIPSGKPHDRCTELLASARMHELIAEMSNRYQDRILIFDSPPVLATTESVALASHMGQIVFVVQAERTRRPVVDSALELIGGQDNVGLVLNRVSPRLGNVEFGYYYGSYYYGREADEASRTK